MKLKTWCENAFKISWHTIFVSWFKEDLVHIFSIIIFESMININIKHIIIC
jgi:hypothetical protein